LIDRSKIPGVVHASVYALETAMDSKRMKTRGATALNLVMKFLKTSNRTKHAVARDCQGVDCTQSGFLTDEGVM
jgi:hypothetical protein